MGIGSIFQSQKTCPISSKNLCNFKRKKRKEKSASEISEDVDNNDDDDDGIVCAVCQSTDGDPSDPIVLCDGCDLMVHASCYGSPLITEIPDGDWFCAQCSRREPTAQDGAPFCCSLCPNRGGAMNPIAGEGGQWAHLVCALFVPEVFFRDSEGREGIDCNPYFI